MDTQSPPSVSTFLPATILLSILGWSGVTWVLVYTTPNGGTRWLLFFAGVVALTGISLPVMAFLNQRFPTTPPPKPIVIIRQAVWVGVYLPILAWLQLGRVLVPGVAILLAVGLILIEWLLRLRERSQWKP